jgi:hypothetical protein
VPTADRRRHAGDGRAVHGVVGQVDEAQPDLGGQRRDQLALGEDPHVDQHPAQAATEPALLVDGRGQLLLSEVPALEQDVAELLHAWVSWRRGSCRPHRTEVPGA